MWPAAAGVVGLLALLPAPAAAEEPAPVSMGASAALVVRSAVPPRFPLSLRGTQHVDGYAVVALTIDGAGRVSDRVSLEASHPAFAREAERAIEQWQFEPAAAGTRPPRDIRQFEFRSAGAVSTLTHAEAAGRGFAAPPVRPQLRTVSWNDLASPPASLAAPAPRLHGNALAALAERPVLVSFVIDSGGTVRVPVVDASVPDAVARPVLAALREWRFAPPRLGDEAVVVQAWRAFGGAGADR